MQANENGINKPTSPSVLKSAHKRREFIAEITPRQSLRDMVLSKTCRAAVDQLIEEQQRSSLLRADGLDPKHRILLVGPPGNGKTSLAEVIAESLAVPFFVVRIIVTENKNLRWEHERDEIRRFLGFGCPYIERVVDCAKHRATLIGWNTIGSKQTDRFACRSPRNWKEPPGSGRCR